MFSTYSKLVRGFRGAGVPVEFLSKPINHLSPQVFQMDIQSSDREGERVRLWMGSRSSPVAVLDGDADWGQLVLSLREPRRRFRHAIRRPTAPMRDRVLADLARTESRLVREHENEWIVQSWTPAAQRKILIGYDDVHLFICQAPWGETVAETHAALKPDEVRDAEYRWPGAVSRQGEWFFVPPRPQDRVALGRATQLVLPGGAIELTGRAHRASERAEIDGRVFVRGKVAHPDHHDVDLEEWRQAIKNRAVIQQAWPGLEWVD
jgi:hypothetical protein